MRQLGAACVAGMIVPLVLAAQQPLPAQAAAEERDSAVRRFVASAREGTARYADRANAVTDGYRAIGVESPGMGQHWVHVGRLLAGQFDAAHPQILNYAAVGGRHMLVGVGYAIPAHDTVELPSAPISRSHWHFHSSTVEDEELLPTHRMAGMSDTALRIAVLHAWVWVDNPEGLFTPDNWALPWVRLGLAPPPGTPVDASRAISLASGGEEYFAALLAHVGRADSDATRQIRAVLVEARADLEVRARSLAREGHVTAADIDWLTDRWAAMWRDLERAVPDGVWAAMRNVRDTH